MASKLPPAGNKKPVKKAIPVVPMASPEPETVPAIVAQPAAPAPLAEIPAPIPVPPVETIVETVTEPVAATIEETVPLAAEIIEDTAPQVVAETVTKGKDIMEATIEKTQAMFADLNERAKATVEKNTKLVAEATEFAKGNVEALVESGKITAKGFEALGQDAAEYSRKSFETATAALKSMSAVKSPADFFRLQSDFVRQSFDSVVAETSKNTEAMMKLAGDAAQPLSGRFAVAVEKVKAAA